MWPPAQVILKAKGLKDLTTRRFNDAV